MHNTRNVPAIQFFFANQPQAFLYAVLPWICCYTHVFVLSDIAYVDIKAGYGSKWNICNFFNFEFIRGIGIYWLLLYFRSAVSLSIIFMLHL